MRRKPVVGMFSELRILEDMDEVGWMSVCGCGGGVGGGYCGGWLLCLVVQEGCEAGDGFMFAEDGEDVFEIGAGGAAGEGDAGGEHELAGFDVVGGGYGGDCLFRGVGVPVRQFFEFLGNFGEQVDVGVGECLGGGVGIGRGVIDEQEVDGGGDFGEESDFVFDCVDGGGGVLVGGEAGGGDEGEGEIDEGLGGGCGDVLLVDPFAFFDVEAARGAVDALEGEAIDQGGEGEDFLV